MTMNGAIKCIDTLVHLYPQSYTKASKEALGVKARAYVEVFKEYDDDIVYQAIIQIYGNERREFEPMPADIKACIQSAVVGDDYLTGSSAWDLLTSIASKYGYMRKTEGYEKLPQVIKNVYSFLRYSKYFEMDNYQATDEKKSFIIDFDNRIKEKKSSGTYNAMDYVLPKRREKLLPSNETIVARMIAERGYDDLPNEYAEIGKQYYAESILGE